MLFKNNSIFISWLLSHILILFVPIFFGVAVYISAEKTVEDEINNSNQAMLEQNQQTLDEALQDITRIIQQIETNKRFKQMMIMPPDEANDSYYSDIVLQAFDDFKNYRVLSGYINDYFIYMKNIDKVLTESSLLDPYIFYKSKMENGSNGRVSQDEWKKLLNGDYSGKFITLAGDRSSENIEAKGLLYTISLPFNLKSDTKAMLVIILNYKKMQSVVQRIQAVENGWGMVLDEDDRILFSTKEIESLPEEIRYEKLINEKSAAYVEISGKKMVVSYIESSESEWKYVTVIPYSDFWQKVEFIRILTIVCTILCIVLGLTISYYLARKNYIPVNDLLSMLMNKRKTTINKGFNEYKFIQKAISDTISENLSISEKLKQQDHVLRSVFLERLLKGKIDDKNQIENTFPLYDLKFESDFFAVVAFYIVDFGSLFEKQYNEKTPEEKLALVRFIIDNVFVELVSKENNGYMAEIDEMNMCLVNFRNPDTGKQELMKAVNEANDFIRSKFKIVFYTAISDMHKSYFGIHEAYHEVLTTIEYQIAMENAEIMDYSDIKGFSGKYNYSVEMENHLINCVKAGDFEKSKSILNDIFDSVFSKNNLPNSLVKCMMFGLANTVFKAVMEVSSICGAEFIEGLAYGGQAFEIGKGA